MLLPPRAVSFDFGQTLVDLDVDFLSRRLAERGVVASSARLSAASPEAWHAYNAAVHKGLGGHPWKLLMRRLLEVAGVEAGVLDEMVEWLWTEQPHNNLWRRPISGMMELVRELRLAGVPVAVLSNSEGRLAEFIDELGWTALFVAIADSGRLGFEKPDREIFTWTAERLGVPLEEVVHVGDSLAADIEGALAAGMRAIWIKGDVGHAARLAPTERLSVCDGASDVRRAFRGFGLAF